MNPLYSFMSGGALSLDLPRLLEHVIGNEVLVKWTSHFLGETTGPIDAADAKRRACHKLERAFTDPGAIARALEPLSPAAIAALALLVDIARLIPRPALTALATKALGSETRARSALAELSERSLLLVAGRDEVGLPSSIAEALSPFVPAHEETAPPDLAIVRPGASALEDALVACVVGAARPRVNRSDRFVNQTDLNRIGKSLAALAPRLAEHLDARVQLLRIHGVLTGVTRLTLDANAGGTVFALDELEWQRRKLATEGNLQSLRARCFDVIDGAPPRFVRRAALENLLRLQYAHIDNAQIEFGPGTDAIDEFVWQLDEARDASGAPAYRLPVRRPRPTTQRLLLVQPNFDVLVPPEASAGLAFQLGRFAELRAAGVYTTFRLTESSVAAAVTAGARVEELTDLLERHATHGVPQNVAHAIAGWGASSGRVHLSVGATLVLDDVAAGNRIEKALDEVHLNFVRPAPNVIIVALDHEDRARTVLSKLNVTPIELNLDEDSPYSRSSSDWARLAVTPRARAEDTAADPAAALSARLAAKLARHRDAPPATPSAPSTEQGPPPTSKPLRDRVQFLVEGAIKSHAPIELTVRVALPDETAMILLWPERLRPRGADLFIEGVTDDDEGRSIPVGAVTDIRSLAVPAPDPFRAGDKPGRNQPCPCGSGKKYKRCCLSRDQQMS